MAGSNLAALFAGHIPKNNPTKAEKVIEPIIALTGIEKIQSFSDVKINNSDVPIKMPAMPPRTHNNTA